MSDAAPTVSTWSRLTGWVSRALNLGEGVTVQTVDETKPIPAGYAYGTGLSTPAEYSPAAALYALAHSPWLHSAIAAKAGDLSTLPIIVQDATGKRLEKHEALALLANPNGRRAVSGGRTIAIRPISARELIEQLAVDLSTGGNAYLYVQVAAGKPVALSWIAPTRVQPIGNSLGSVAGYAIDDGSGFGGSSNAPCATYGQSGMVSAHRFRARYDAVDLSGMAPVAPLDGVITADMHATTRAAESSRKGRPDAIAAPPAGAATLSTQQIAQAQDSLTRAFSGSDQGVAVISGNLEITPLAWSPKEMEEATRAEQSRAAVLAVTGVPPVRLGLETANYATAREQTAQHWSGIKILASQLEGMLDMLGACYSPPVQIRFDFRGVAALQDDRGARLDRVTQHIANGIGPARAYALEGFTDIVETDFAPVGEDDDQGSASVAIQDLLDALEDGDAELIAEAADAARQALSDGG